MFAAESYLDKLSNSGTSLTYEEEQNLQWQAFHLFSQAHSTLYHHRYQQKALRQMYELKQENVSIKYHSSYVI